jgi:hypothetical protein
MVNRVLTNFEELISKSLFRRAWAHNQPLWAITFFSMGQSRAHEAPVIESHSLGPQSTSLAFDKSRFRQVPLSTSLAFEVLALNSKYRAKSPAS